MFYKRKALNWIKEVNSAWRAREINDVDYMLMIDTIINSKKYTQYNFDFAMRINIENYKHMQEYKRVKM